MNSTFGEFLMKSAVKNLVASDVGYLLCLYKHGYNDQ
jgi:hypothetical protein